MIIGILFIKRSYFELKSFFMDVRVPQSRQSCAFNRNSTFLLLTRTSILHFSVVNLFIQSLSRYLIDLQFPSLVISMSVCSNYGAKLDKYLPKFINS